MGDQQLNLSTRMSGILLHPTSLPGGLGIGDLGQEAYKFIDFLVQCHQQIWQILPLGPTGHGNSPYMAYSALAGNPLLINLEWLSSEGLLEEEDFEDLPEWNNDRVDYDLVIKTKMPLLRKASNNFFKKASPERIQAYELFCKEKAQWLDDYALFMALKQAHNDQPWNQWAPSIAKREPQAIQEWTKKLESEIFFQKYIQSEFFRQWSSLKKYANDRGIQIFGDIPIYVAWDSADVWANPEIFSLDEETGEPALMAGVPPDYFSETGQLWGNPVYNWETLKETDFKWWIERFEGILDYVDLVRIDHFRGFEAYWAVPKGETVAINGEWLEAPGAEFFTLLQNKLGNLPIIAEDLGVITPEVEALRDNFEFPGMKVLQFAFDSGPDNIFLPFNYQPNCIVYTGTHDNDTTVGWYKARSPKEQQQVLDYLGLYPAEGINWALIRIALSSVANRAIFPLQDLLGLDSDARMNFPGQQEGNWNWRYRAKAITPAIRKRLKKMTGLYGRAPEPTEEPTN